MQPFQAKILTRSSAIELIVRPCFLALAPSTPICFGVAAKAYEMPGAIQAAEAPLLQTWCTDPVQAAIIGRCSCLFLMAPGHGMFALRIMVFPIVRRPADRLDLQRTGRQVDPLLCQQAAVSAGKACCEPIETNSIAIMTHGFNRGVVVFFKSSLISY